jgi:glucose-1-phosphate cytidylyltransferase
LSLDSSIELKTEVVEIQALILAGGLGTRLSEETNLRPKPMVEIGGMPIIMHIISSYLKQGVDDFVILAGYKSDQIKDYFSNYARNISTKSIFEFKSGQFSEKHTTQNTRHDFRVTVLETGLKSETAQRLKQAEDLISESSFFLTYGDGVSDIDIWRAEALRQRQRLHACLTAVSPPARYGSLSLTNIESSPQEKIVSAFSEKTRAEEGYVNGGFMALSIEIFDYISASTPNFEKDVLPMLAAEGKLGAVLHSGFWQSMDTMRDKIYLNEIWDSGSASW